MTPQALALSMSPLAESVLRSAAGQLTPDLPYADTIRMNGARQWLVRNGLAESAMDDDQPTMVATEAGLAALAARDGPTGGSAPAPATAALRLDDGWANMRWVRSQGVAAVVLRELEDFIPRACADDAYRRVTTLLAREGIEVLTDEHRAHAGLPPRDERGWTREDLLALETRRREVMLASPKMLVVASDGSPVDAP